MHGAAQMARRMCAAVHAHGRGPTMTRVPATQRCSARTTSPDVRATESISYNRVGNLLRRDQPMADAAARRSPEACVRRPDRSAAPSLAPGPSKRHEYRRVSEHIAYGAASRSPTRAIDGDDRPGSGYGQSQPVLRERRGGDAAGSGSGGGGITRITSSPSETVTSALAPIAKPASASHWPPILIAGTTRVSHCPCSGF